MTLPGDATPDTTFRCVHFACTLAVRHCVRRQAARREGVARNDFGATAWSKPTHEHCASGKCEQGNEIRARFAGLMEEAMPKGVRTKPHPCCGSMGSRHLGTCKGAAKAAPPMPAAAPQVVRPSGPEAMSVEELLELRDRVEAELRGRFAEEERRVAEAVARLERLRGIVARDGAPAEEAAA